MFIHRNSKKGGEIKTSFALSSGVKGNLDVTSPHIFALQLFVLYLQRMTFLSQSIIAFPRFRSFISVQIEDESCPRVHLETMLKADNFCMLSCLEYLKDEQRGLTPLIFQYGSKNICMTLVTIPTSWMALNSWYLWFSIVCLFLYHSFNHNVPF